MNFPILATLANQDVTLLNIDTSLDASIDLMYKENHRSVIIQSGEQYFIITASDLLKLKLKGYDFSKSLHTIQLTQLPIIDKEKNILETISFLEQSIEYVCVTNKDGSFYGLLTHTDIISNMDPETMMENFKLKDLIHMNKVIDTVQKEQSTASVLEQMSDQLSDSVIVVDNNIPIGIVTTKDVMRLLKSSFSLELPISNYMTTPVESLYEDATIKEAISFMKQKHFKRVVVLNKDQELCTIILQRELISLSYNKWATLMKEYSQELSQINELLQKKTKKYELMASTDQLTQLYNRYKFTEIFISEYKTMCSRKNIMSVVLFDIDYFKRINDTFGHNIGDKVLKQIAKITLDVIRNVDVVCRWGGEEFALLLPTADIKNASIVSQKLKDAIEKAKIIDNYTVTISVGITEVTIDDTLEKAIKRADEALYQAKNSGRNTICLG